MIKSKLKNILRPTWRKLGGIRQWLELIQIYVYDFRRFSRFYVNASSKKTGKEELQGWILQDKHRIEKGISLPNVRPNFGRAVLERLFKHLKMYRSGYEKDKVYFWGIGAFLAYYEFHRSKNMPLETWFLKMFRNLDNDDIEHPLSQEVGLSPLAESEISPESFKGFCYSRSSARSFNVEKSISKEKLRSIVTIALKTPSVCNRQHWKVHIVSGELKKKVLRLQNGNAGFGNDAPQVAIITSSLKAFYLPSERAQAYTDGGLFSMSFILACHAYGLASCALNWSASLIQDKEIRKLNVVEDDETIIMLIALGYAKDNSMVAKSPRKSVDEILTIH